MDIRSISVSEARSIRHEVLRPGRPESEVTYPSDDSELAIHLGACEGSRLIGVATFLPEKCMNNLGANAWRLRGMAVLEPARGQGLGSQLLTHGIDRALRAGVNVLWCNGRVLARSFYERHGFSAIGDVFFIPVSGPHYLFVLQVGANNSFKADGFAAA
jgi:GNAT superfamily N-acetyltransferase